MFFDPTCQYQESHEWVRVKDDVAVIGISDYAQDQLNDIVYVELPEVGDELDKGDALGTVESVKAASDLYAPVSGEVIAINGNLEDEPEIVNRAPYGDGWMVRIQMSDTTELEDLLNAKEYELSCQEDEEEENEEDEDE